MLSVANLSRRFDEVIAVDDVSFDIDAGEIVGLLGHNGAGKTTVMKLLTGYLEPSAGKISFNGSDVVEKPQLAREEIGYLPENSPLYGELTVVDYLSFSASIRQLDPDLRSDHIRRTIHETDLVDRAMQKVRTLSRGFQQRVGVAQAILHRPKLLILDEPTNGLDPSQTQHMRDLIRQLAETATVILSTHIMQEVEAICDRVLILSNGKLTVDEQLSELKQTRRIILNSPSEPDRIRDSIPELADVSQDNGSFILTPRDSVSESTELEALISQVVPLLVGAGVAIHRIEPEHRSLEALFRDSSDEVQDAN